MRVYAFFAIEKSED